ncbi:transcription factor bHLH143-like [Carica papaya]|uniref:transcription factor bHLH143-like n=1 Tax=Carica papaya TaxID=3649 RepID=UPI000B8D1799|nr:transcription factor bHLH143-like [Carica papaya]XP_021895110.1 transcription factor bHLH143-like [Carica papaya]
MVKDNNSWLSLQNFHWQFRKANCMSTLPEFRQTECLPGAINPGIFPVNMTLPKPAGPCIPNLKLEEEHEAHKLLQYMQPHFQTKLPGKDLYPKELDPIFRYGIQEKAAAAHVTSGSSQNRLVIFDQSGNQTRLLCSFLCPARCPNAAVTELMCGPILHEGETIKVDQFTPKEAIFHEESDENDLYGEDSEMHEDTEEINALLYSDDDEDCGKEYGNDNDDDEVMSTGHSPVTIKGAYNEQEQLEEITEEVASSDGPHKRQKLLDGGYGELLLVGTANSVKSKESHEDDDDVEPSYDIGQAQTEEVGSIPGNKRLRNDKIRSTLRILESIIPRAKGKDPLVVLDEAIDYLKLLKHKGSALGVNWY